MKILAVVRLYPPFGNAGAELMTHTILRWLADRGHQCSVVCMTASQEYVLEDVRVMTLGALPDEDADVVLSYLEAASPAHRHAQTLGVPFVRLVHSQWGYGQDAALHIVNSRWVSELVGEAHGPYVVCRPPVFKSDYRTDRRLAGKLTLVNLMAEKGGELFWELAARNPDREFMGVLGAWGEQIVHDGHANVEVVDNTWDMRWVYRHTRILLMPSSYESWGRVGVEAMASGIPVIAHPTEGLVESLGEAGVFRNRGDVAGWEEAIAELDSDIAYAHAAAACLERSAELNQQAEDDLAELEYVLSELCGAHV